MARRIRGVLAAFALSGAVTAAVATPALALAPGAPDPPRGDFDARADDRAPIPAATADARAVLTKRLGPQASVSADPVTGGLRSVGRTDAALTGPSDQDPATIALAYVRAHATAFGLDAADIATLHEDTRSTTGDGVTHLIFRQEDGGIAAYDSALTAAVARDGRLVSLGGAPVHDLQAPSTTPPLGPAAARTAAQDDLRVTPDGDAGTIGSDPAQTTTFANGDSAHLVTVADPDGDRLAWELTVAAEPPYVFDVLVDAASGAVLARHSLTDFLASKANVVGLHPGDGSIAATDIGQWLTTGTNLTGPYAHAYPDRYKNDGISGDTEIVPSSGTDFLFTTTPVLTPATGQHCPTVVSSACTWNGTSVTHSSVTANVAAVTAQVFYYVNNYHDWLASSPIDFDAGDFNFEGADPVKAETDDYSGYNNANMSTPADGTSPTMQMYLFKSVSGGPSYPAVNGAEDATVVYHEYTHGLTNRLVGQGGANGLDARQSQAMGEGWSDWYALDFLTAEGELTDDPSQAGDEVVGAYVTDNPETGIRTNAIDCPVDDADATHCPGTSRTGGPGGFTFGDLGRVSGYDSSHPLFEVHADGEIWAETLWDLRQAIGGHDARELITEALRLSPLNPSFLDMRDAILKADVAEGGTHHDQIWQVFARRGMGFSARTASANATHAVEAFDTPPVAAPGAPDVASAALEQDTALHIPITNPSGTPLTNVHATLTTGTAGVAIPQGSADLGTIAPGASTPAAFTVRVGATAGCGSVAATTLTITSDQGTQSFPVGLPVGSGRSGALTQADGRTIPDGSPSTGLTSTLNVTTHGRVGNLRVTLAATHAFIGDLHAWLTSPSGTTVDLMEQPGAAPGPYFSRANLAAATPLVFDDDATDGIQDILDAEATIAGAYRPNQPLSRFAGEDRYGPWTLRISDAATPDAGTLTSWSLEPSDPACAVTDAPTGLVNDAGTFGGRVDPGATPGTTAAFELGTTTAYDRRSPEVALTPGGGLQAFSTTSGGLVAGTTYHVRAIVLRGGAIVAAGADRTFVAGSDATGGTSRGGPTSGATTTTTGTGTTTATPPALTPPTLTVPKATLSGLPKAVRLDRKGRLALSFRAGPSGSRSTIKLRAGKASAGSRTFTVPKGGRVKLTITASQKVRAALRKQAAVKTRVTIRIGVTSFTATLTIKPYKKPAAR